ncbi:MAG TPA: NAD(P)H-dependent oxidoreductase subunit E [Chthoniobacterales bacterium]|jgi:NADH-quinone oxidoreductase subunit E|nr:NAD(P)H-dependent oxidoreductase subunit E [Chthoniobacterales bacterium]
MEIPAELESQIDEVITHYPVSKRSASLPLLHLFQEYFGRIEDEAIEWVARKLELEPINVLELVTFYPMFRREPLGKHHIRVCRTLSCAMAGGYQLLDTFCKHANIVREQSGHGDHLLKSTDGKYSIEFVECLASCGFGPVCMIDDDFFEAVAQEEVPQLLEKYQ